MRTSHVPCPTALSPLAALFRACQLESEGEGLQLLVPNHDLYRPEVQGEPFSTLLVPDRASGDWQEVLSENQCKFYCLPLSENWCNHRCLLN